MLTARQETILRIIIDDYVKSAAPIASDWIARHHELGVSPATVRNDVAALEEAGFITRPHTSAGSVPLDKAYRFYVESQRDSTSETSKISSRVRDRIKSQLSEVENDVEVWANVAAELLAELAGNLAVATFPRSRETRIKHLELVPMQELLVMLIVVLGQARLRRHLIRLQEPIDRASIEAITNRMNAHLMGLSRRDLDSRVMDLTPFEQEIADATGSILLEEERQAYREHYVNGLRNLLNQPEFQENDRLKAVVSAVEDGSLVEAILREAPQSRLVRVVIGQENDGNLLWPLSIVICQYGVPNEAVGALGVVGPTRMEYARTISGVRFMSSIMSDYIENVNI
jgi:heat-inducible transcriptional repressor